MANSIIKKDYSHLTVSATTSNLINSDLILRRNNNVVEIDFVGMKESVPVNQMTEICQIPSEYIPRGDRRSFLVLEPSASESPGSMSRIFIDTDGKMYAYVYYTRTNLHNAHGTFVYII